jgi:hypothetical protein
MARAGQIIENPITGVKLIFHKTSHESDGASWEAEEFLKPFAGKVSMAHYHPYMDEIFVIISGSACYLLDGVEHQARAGDVVTLPAGIPHIHPWSNSGEGLHMRHMLRLHRPDYKSLIAVEDFAETLFGLAREGKVNKEGLPNLWQLMVILKALQPGGYMAGMPVTVQRVVFGALAGVGRLLGYKARYPRFTLSA